MTPIEVETKSASLLVAVVSFVVSPNVTTGLGVFQAAASLVLGIVPHGVLVAHLDAAEKARIDAQIDNIEAGITAAEGK